MTTAKMIIMKFQNMEITEDSKSFLRMGVGGVETVLRETRV